AALFYFAVLLWLWWVRVQVVLAALLLYVFAPLAAACWVLPFGPAQWAARAWGTLLLGTAVVQVLQSLTLGVGAARLAANVVGGRVEGVGAGVVDLALAAALVGATAYVPRRVLGALVLHAPPGAGWAARGLQAGLLLAGAGWAPGMVPPVASGLGASGGAWGNSGPGVPPPPPPAGRVGSLLGGQRPPALPPPTP